MIIRCKSGGGGGSGVRAAAAVAWRGWRCVAGGVAASMRAVA